MWSALDADVRLTGDADEDSSYRVMTEPGDVDGDGVADLLVGSYSNDLPFDGGAYAGMVYVIPGIGM